LKERRVGVGTGWGGGAKREGGRSQGDALEYGENDLSDSRC